MKSVLFLVLLLGFTNIVSCQNNQKQLQKNQPSKSLDACKIVKSRLDVLIIKANAKRLLKGKDECVLALIDSMYDNFIRSDNLKYLEALEAFYNESDGYVTEYLLEIGTKLFYKKLKLIATYLNRQKSTKGLEKLIVESMSSELSNADDVDKSREAIKKFIDKQIVKNKIGKEESAYLKRLIEKFDPTKFN